MLREKLFSFITYAGAFILAYILIFSIFVRTPAMVRLPSFMLLFFTGAVIVAVLGLYHLLNRYKMLSGTFYFILFLALLTLIPRLVWIMTVDTAPVSDFFLYHDYAVKASKGLFTQYPDTYPLFPFKLGYPLVLSIIYRVFGADMLAVKVFNVLISVCTALLVYWTGRKIYGETAGRMAGLMFALWPAQIMYNSVLGSEHVFMLFFALSLAIFIKMQFYTKGAVKHLLPLLMGVCMALAHFIRPVSFILFPVVLIYLFVFVKNVPFKKSIIGKIGTLAAITAGFIITLSVLSIIVLNLTGVQIWKSSSGFSLLVGTNLDSSGMYSSDDEKIIAEYKYDTDRVHKEAARRAFERIKASPLSFACLAEKKLTLQWADEEYGMYWSCLRLSTESTFSTIVKNNWRKLTFAYQLFYICVLVLAAAGCIYSRKSYVYLTVVLLLIFEAFVAAHTLLEVQSRYHYAAIPILMLIAGYGAVRLTEDFSAKYLSKLKGR